MFSSNTTGVTTVSRGESVYTIPGTYSWVCPAGVTSVSVVCVGAGGPSVNDGIDFCGGSGGALAWANDISVTPGTSYSIVVGQPNGDWTGSGVHQSGSSSAFGRVAGGGQGIISNGATPSGGTPSGVVGTSRGGGNGGVGGISDNGSGKGGGGAGGYSGNGGRGRDSSLPTAGSGGGGGGGQVNGPGGGVGLYGEGASGAAASGTGSAFAKVGKGGSGGANGANSSLSTSFTVAGPSGGNFGGGGANPEGGAGARIFPGGVGAVRIVWPGTTRQFPSTDVGTP